VTLPKTSLSTIQIFGPLGVKMAHPFKSLNSNISDMFAFKDMFAKHVFIFYANMVCNAYKIVDP
jgi:hypothetical protein